VVSGIAVHLLKSLADSLPVKAQDLEHVQQLTGWISRTTGTV